LKITLEVIEKFVERLEGVGKLLRVDMAVVTFACPA
jgi:hypothetical protein